MKKLALFLIILLSVTFLTNCSVEEQRPLKVGVLLWPAYEVFFLADSLGFYEDEDIYLLTYLSPSEALRGYRNGLLDAVALTNQFVPELYNRDSSQRVILVIDQSKGGDALIARKEIENAGDLQGRTVAVEAGPLSYYMLNRALDHLKLDVEDINIITMDVGLQENAFLLGEVDALVTYEPFKSALKNKGARELFSSREIEGEISDLLVTRDKVIREKNDKLRQLISGYFKAVEYYQENPQKAMAIMGKRENLSAEEMKRVLKGVEILGLNENLLLKDSFYTKIDTVARTLIRIGLLDKAPPSQKIWYPRFIEEQN